MKLRHGVLLLLTLLAALTYMDRLCIAVLGPTMKRELGLSAIQWGWIMGAFTVAYGGFEIPAGALGDRFGQRSVLTRIVLWWSAFTILTGSVSSFAALLLVRFLFGAGEAGAFPNVTGSTARWFPATERARVQGMVWGASRLGAVLTPLLVGLVLTAGGTWRAPFWLFGLLGLFWVTFWRRWYWSDPAEHPSITEEELAEIGHVPVASHHAGVPWMRLFQSPQIWRIMLMYSFYAWGSTFYLTWLHTYLVEGRGLGEQQMKWLSTLPFILGAIANPLGGFLSDLLSRRLGLSIGRRLMGSSCMVLAAAFLLATASTPGKWSAVVLLSFGFGALDLMLSSAWAICMDVGGQYAGAVSGAMNSFGHVGGTACSILFGYIVKWNGSYDAPLVVIAAMLMISSMLFLTIDPTRPIFGTDERLPSE